MVATEAPPQRRLITGGDPDSRYPIPKEGDFVKPLPLGATALTFHDYIPAPELQKIGEALIASKLTGLMDEVAVEYLWKRKGGTTRGKWNMGKCQKLTGLARFFSVSADFVVWLAADFCESYKLTRWQMEALLFHELLHIEIEEPEDEDKPTIKRPTDHDFEGFYVEITEYGLWQRELARLSEIVQPSLPFVAEL